MTIDVLVVDDESARLIVERLQGEASLKDRFYFVPVISCDAALRELGKTERTYRLAILDYLMPRKDGPATAKELRAINPDLKLIGHSNPWNDESARTAGLEFYCGSSYQPLIDYLTRLEL